MKSKLKEFINSNLGKVILINLAIFIIANILFNIKYEQVDDFIMYKLYSGLDGTYNIHGIYMYPLLCFIIGIFFRAVSWINWHTIFLLTMQFICFTIIGKIIVEKHKKCSIWIYIIFASISYTTLLLLIQYTSVSALIIGTSFLIILDGIERKKQDKKYKILYIILFTIGIMTRMQSLLIIAPFMGIYFLYNIIRLIKKEIEVKEIVELIKQYSILLIITIVVYVSNILVYNANPVYKEYMEYNSLRATLHDMSYTPYEENKKIFDEIGWSKNDHYLFYTFNFGDENVYSKENLQKIIDYKISTNQYYNLELEAKNIAKKFVNEFIGTNKYLAILILTILIINLVTNKKQRIWNVAIFITTIGIHILFIILNRSMLRVVIPEYIIGTALLMYFSKTEKELSKKLSKYKAEICMIIIIALVLLSGTQYKYGYELKNYKQYQEIIKYTNEHKENTYLYTVPSLQDRYLTYSVYTMPPKNAFSNLRVIGGWDIFTQNYYEFKERNNLEGTFLDLLKENVYLIDGEVDWSGNHYKDYIKHIVLFIKEHYNIDVKYEKVKEFNNLYIYKILFGTGQKSFE